MSIPEPGGAIPTLVRRLAAGAAIEPVWRNERGGLAFRLGTDRFVKIGRRTLETSMRGEAERMTWARRYTPVPEVLETGGDEDTEWLVTRAMPGRSAVDPRWVARADAAVRAMGEGLRALHDALPADGCPFDWSGALLDAYGVASDAGRMRFYRDLWNAT